MLAVGLAVLLLAGADYGYNVFRMQEARADPWRQQLEASYAQNPATAQPTASVIPTATVQPSASPTTTSQPVPAALTPAPTPAVTPNVYPEPEGIRIPAIGVESRVVAAGIKDGRYEVAPFYVSHYLGTANPGQPGNGVYSGHVESIQSGNVFARLPELTVGAEVTVYTRDRPWTYRVTATKVARNDDLSVMDQTSDRRLTLITCVGEWIVASHDYSHRFIAIAQLVDQRY